MMRGVPRAESGTTLGLFPEVEVERVPNAVVNSTIWAFAT